MRGVNTRRTVGSGRSPAPDAYLVPLFPLVKQAWRREHLEHVVAQLVVGHQHAGAARLDGGVQPVPVVVGAGGRGVQLLCAQNGVFF